MSCVTLQSLSTINHSYLLVNMRREIPQTMTFRLSLRRSILYNYINMAKTRARKSHRPVTPILQLVGAIWSVKDKKTYH